MPAPESSAPTRNDIFIKGFLPGVVLGIVVGAVAGATLPTLLQAPPGPVTKGTHDPSKPRVPREGEALPGAQNTDTPQDEPPTGETPTDDPEQPTTDPDEPPEEPTTEPTEPPPPGGG